MDEVIFKKTELKNGIRILSETHPESKAVSIGIWVLTGTRDEMPDQAGISHFLEHLVFKGTKNRSAYKIAQSLECLGGELNAYTTREYTCFHALVLKDHWIQALDVLCDLVSNMKLSDKEFKLEKGVILQEIAMSEDSEEDIIYDHFLSAVLKGNALGNPILGSNKSVVSMKKTAIQSYYKNRYSGKNLIVSLAGDIQHEEFLFEANKRLKQKKMIQKTAKRKVPQWQPSFKKIESHSDQVHLLVGFPTAGYKDEHRFHSYLMNTALGGGMTSRLYQSVREKKGLVYSIHSMLNTFVDCGQIMIYASTEPKQYQKVLDITMSELKKLKDKGLAKGEFEMYKTQIIGSILLGSDDIENRMTSISVNEMVFNEYRSVEKVIEEIRQISLKDMNTFLNKQIQMDQISTVLMGKV